MSKLATFVRPTVYFNPNNKDHRQWLGQFHVNHSWRHCPVRFVVEDDYGDLLTQMNKMLIEYYTKKEFKKVRK